MAAPDEPSEGKQRISNTEVRRRKDQRAFRELFLGLANFLVAGAFLFPWIDVPDSGEDSVSIAGWALPSAAEAAAYFSGAPGLLQDAMVLRLLVYGTLVCAVSAGIFHLLQLRVAGRIFGILGGFTLAFLGWQLFSAIREEGGGSVVGFGFWLAAALGAAVVIGSIVTLFTRRIPEAQ